MSKEILTENLSDEMRAAGFVSRANSLDGAGTSFVPEGEQVISGIDFHFSNDLRKALYMANLSKDEKAIKDAQSAYDAVYGEGKETDYSYPLIVWNDGEHRTSFASVFASDLQFEGETPKVQKITKAGSKFLNKWIGSTKPIQTRVVEGDLKNLLGKTVTIKHVDAKQLKTFAHGTEKAAQADEIVVKRRFLIEDVQ